MAITAPAALTPHPAGHDDSGAHSPDMIYTPPARRSTRHALDLRRSATGGAARLLRAAAHHGGPVAARRSCGREPGAVRRTDLALPRRADPDGTVADHLLPGNLNCGGSPGHLFGPVARILRAVVASAFVSQRLRPGSR